MAVIEETTTIYKCSDGKSFFKKLDADIHEAELSLKEQCDKYGYSASGFSRDFLLWDLACLVAGNADADPMVFPLLRADPVLQADYMARLTGERALNAPPAET